jgi:hypothetical protein
MWRKIAAYSTVVCIFSLLSSLYLHSYVTSSLIYFEIMALPLFLTLILLMKVVGSIERKEWDDNDMYLISSGALCLVLASTIPLAYRFIPETISTVFILVVTAEILLIQILVLRELRKRRSGEISEKFKELPNLRRDFLIVLFTFIIGLGILFPISGRYTLSYRRGHPLELMMYILFYSSIVAPASYTSCVLNKHRLGRGDAMELSLHALYLSIFSVVLCFGLFFYEVSIPYSSIGLMIPLACFSSIALLPFRHYYRSRKREYKGYKYNAKA